MSPRRSVSRDGLQDVAEPLAQVAHALDDEAVVLVAAARLRRGDVLGALRLISARAQVTR